MKDPHLNRLSSFSSIGAVIPTNFGFTMTAAYSLAKFTLPAECPCVCCFGSTINNQRSVYAICVDGTFHKYVFKNEGHCERDNFDFYPDVPDEKDHFFI